MIETRQRIEFLIELINVEPTTSLPGNSFVVRSKAMNIFSAPLFSEGKHADRQIGFALT